MGIRDTLNNNPAMTTSGAVVVLLICLGAIVWYFGGGGSGGPDESYYFDLNSKEIFAAKAASAPVQAPSGPTQDGQPAGVSARIYACGECKGSYAGMTFQDFADDNAMLAYLQRQASPSPGQGQGQGGQQGGNGNRGMMPRRTGYNMEVAKPAEKLRWVHITSPAGQQIMSFDLNCPEDQSPRACYPGN